MRKREPQDRSVVFPPGFVWGAATSSYQVEGGWDADGKGESIWDRFSHTPGKIADGTNGDVACDHYHRWQEDVALMKESGLQAYRFSIGWPRVLPEGRGRVNQAGLDFYSRLVDALLEVGIQPFATLYHWDLPQALEDQGGWPARTTAEAFVEYADLMSGTLGDRVKHWMTLNEPLVSAMAGYGGGVHAPGYSDRRKGLLAAHHLLLGHGWAVPIIRRNVPGAQVGAAVDTFPKAPASPSFADRSAAWQQDGMTTRWIFDPIAARGYPVDVVRARGTALDFVQGDDMKTIAAPLDFMGVNYYSRKVVRSEEIAESENEPRTLFAGPEFTEMGWEVYPDGLYELLGRLYFDYHFPAFYITENGAAYPDQIGPDGKVDDAGRILYLRRHFVSAARAIAAGVPLKGYFVWSLMDNFEWANGYTKRFGLTYVDYSTQRRTLKASARWYSRVIAANAVVD